MLTEVYRWIGYGLCHQLPERSFFGGGLQVPVCARDTGIYVGFAISLALVAILHRGERPRRFPGPFGWVVMGLLFAIFAWDGVTSYGGLRESTNQLRLITGLGVGYSAAAVLVPILNDEVWTSSSAGSVLSPWWRLLAWVGSLPLAWALVWWGFPLLGAMYPAVVSAAIFITLTAMNLVMVAMLPSFDRKARRLADLATPVAISFGMALAEIVASALVRQLLLGTAARVL